MFFEAIGIGFIGYYVIVALLFVIVYEYRHLTKKMPNMIGKHVVITGGSSGLGIALAKDSFSNGASDVTLIARKMEQLEAAAAKIPHKEGQKIHLISADVTNIESLTKAFDQIKELGLKIDYLFANAGYARPGEFQDLPIQEFKNQVEVNGVGAMLATRLAYPLFNEGAHVTFSGSICSVLTFSGYAAYGPSKYALKGFADTIRNEFTGKKIHVHMGILSSMDSPGYLVENRSKPTACTAIEGTAHLFQPEDISKYVFYGINRNDYFIYTEILTFFIINCSYGLNPSNNIFADLLIAPFIPIIRFFTVIYIDTLAKLPNKLKEKKD